MLSIVEYNYRYGFQAQEKDDEVSGAGNSYDFGARMHNPRIGRFFSRDGFANKFAYQSPYVFAGNMPIWATDHNGDSVLFYSKSGEYLGYSHDNQRYKGKNLLVIIDDKQVQSFKNQYSIKRNAEYSSPQAKEAYVAGLEGMGTTYDVTEMMNFVKKYTHLVGPNKDNTKPAPLKQNSQQEWGADLIPVENPKTGKFNWVSINPESITTVVCQMALLVIPKH